MSAWRRKAIELLHEHRDIIQAAGSPMFLWTELGCVFSQAVESDDRDTLGRVLAFARWCWKGSRSRDAASAALIGFYEGIPCRRERWWVVPSFISSTDFHEMEGVFRYFLNDDQFAEFTDYYFRERKQLEKTALNLKRAVGA